MKKCALFVMVFLLAISVRAQEETPQYRLRVPTAEEYLASLSSIAAVSGSNGRDVDHSLIRLLEDDFRVRYGHTADVATLSEFYETFRRYGYESYAQFSPDIDLAGWNILIVQRWLELNPTDFSAVTEFRFDLYTVAVDAYDFNNDGETDWLLHVIRENDFQDYWIAHRDDADSSGYQISRLPIPFQAASFWPAQEEWGGAHLLAHEDVNADGLDELIFDSYGVLPSSGAVGAYRYFYILGWQHDGFQVLTVRNITQADGTIELSRFNLIVLAEDANVWEFENLDGDAPLELVERVRYEDNWLCVRDTYAVYDWNGEYYEKTIDQSTFQETVNCALRQAEDAVFSFDYETAIPFYQLALVRYASLNETESEGFEPGAAYAQERLALAYALAGQMDEALTLIDEMRSQLPVEGTIAAALVTAATDGVTAYKLCEAAYDTMFQFGQDWYQGGQRFYRGILDPGPTDESYYTITALTPNSPDYTGCNIAHLIRQLLTEQSFSVDQTPVEILTEIGIETIDSLHTDLNNDGSDEWLIWLEQGYEPVFFTPQGETYYVSFVSFPRPGATAQLNTINLPDDSGRAWVVTLYSGGGVRICTLYDGFRYGDIAVNRLSIWQLEDAQLVVTQELPVCERPTPEELFSVEGELHGWIANGYTYDPETEYVPQTYTWDSEQQIYILPSQQNEVEVTTAQTSPVYFNVLTPYHVSFALFFREDYQAVVEMVGALFSGMVDTSQAFDLHYYRALALEMLNRPDEALAEYIAIYSAAPESAWAQLAALHLERVD